MPNDDRRTASDDGGAGRPVASRLGMSGRFVVRHKQAGQYHFVLKAENGHVLATRETYTTKRRWLDGIESVKRRAADAPVADAAPDG
jgi:uncharacterized protein YegP (UPF0339 family)